MKSAHAEDRQRIRRLCAGLINGYKYCWTIEVSCVTHQWVAKSCMPAQHSVYSLLRFKIGCTAKLQSCSCRALGDTMRPRKPGHWSDTAAWKHFPPDLYSQQAQEPTTNLPKHNKKLIGITNPNASHVVKSWEKHWKTILQGSHVRPNCEILRDTLVRHFGESVEDIFVRHKKKHWQDSLVWQGTRRPDTPLRRRDTQETLAGPVVGAMVVQSGSASSARPVSGTRIMPRRPSRVQLNHNPQNTVCNWSSVSNCPWIDYLLQHAEKLGWNCHDVQPNQVKRPSNKEPKRWESINYMDRQTTTRHKMDEHRMNTGLAHLKSNENTSLLSREKSKQHAQQGAPAPALRFQRGRNVKCMKFRISHQIPH